MKVLKYFYPIVVVTIVMSCSDSGTDSENADNTPSPEDIAVDKGGSDADDSDLIGAPTDTATETATDNKNVVDMGDSGTGIWNGIDTQTDAVVDTDVDTGTDVTLLPATCPAGMSMHTSASGKVVCCDESHPVFCDENGNGYTGSCWTDGVDCDTIILCGESWRACYADALPFCDSAGVLSCQPCGSESTVYQTASGRPVCCSKDRPVFCDETAEGYPGGCWSSVVDCDTITFCGANWTACPSGTLPTCVGNMVSCQTGA